MQTVLQSLGAVGTATYLGRLQGAFRTPTPGNDYGNNQTDGARFLKRIHVARRSGQNNERGHQVACRSAGKSDRFRASSMATSQTTPTLQPAWRTCSATCRRTSTIRRFLRRKMRSSARRTIRARHSWDRRIRTIRKPDKRCTRKAPRPCRRLRSRTSRRFCMKWVRAKSAT